MCADFNTLWCYPDKAILNPFALQIQPMQTAFLADFQSNLYENSFNNTAHLHRWLFCEALEQKREDLRWSVLDYSDTAKIIKLWLYKFSLNLLTLLYHHTGITVSINNNKKKTVR